MTTDRHPAPGRFLEHALGTGDDAVAAHLEQCAPCRSTHRELLEGVDLVLPAVPRVAPPPGFETAVLGLLQAQGPARRSRGRLPRWGATAAGLLLGLALGAGGASVLDGDQRERGEAVPPLAPERSATLTSADGSPVGTVARAYGEGRRRLVVVVSAGGPEGDVTCRAVLADGSEHDLARWRVTGQDVWVVVDPGATRVELVEESGRVWATADL